MDDSQRFSDNDVKNVLFAFRDALGSYCEVLNALNVYPVPDGDTGTNMSLTLISVTAEIEKGEEEGSSQWKAISHGSLMGARGNSGVILSQILRSLADSFSEAEGIDTAA
ncbi:MAG: DAK2 domain-containing protein, partial [Actinomycetota bacterium]|nr:DAK2 domain-containing protein [Actinomycetota bacterium]